MCLLSVHFWMLFILFFKIQKYVLFRSEYVLVLILESPSYGSYRHLMEQTPDSKTLKLNSRGLAFNTQTKNPTIYSF